MGLGTSVGRYRGTRPTLDESRIRQKRKADPASGAALQFLIGAGGEQPRLRDFSDARGFSRGSGIALRKRRTLPLGRKPV